MWGKILFEICPAFAPPIFARGKIAVTDCFNEIKGLAPSGANKRGKRGKLRKSLPQACPAFAPQKNAGKSIA